MIKIYEIRYKFNDDLPEKGWRNSTVVVYDAFTSADGAILQHALDRADKDGDYSGVDKILEKYGTKDDEVVFYFGNTGIENESLVLELQRDLDIIINNIHFITII